MQSGTTRRRRRRTGHLTLTLKEMTIIGNTDCGRRVVALHTLAAILQRKIKRHRTPRCRYCRSSAACIPCQSRSSSGTQRAAPTAPLCPRLEPDTSVSLRDSHSTWLSAQTLHHHGPPVHVDIELLQHNINILPNVHFVHQICVNLKSSSIAE